MGCLSYLIMWNVISATPVPIFFTSLDAIISCFQEFLYDWGLLIVTAIYSVFTICIFKSNQKANELTRKQIDDSRKQYVESKRLEILPYFKLEYKPYVYSHTTPHHFISYWKFDSGFTAISKFTLVLENIGLGAAKCVRYCYAFDDDDISFDPYIGRGDSIPITFTVDEMQEVSYCITHPATADFIERDIEKIKLFIGITYEDLLSNKYMQLLEIDYALNPIHPLYMISCVPHEQIRIDNPPEQNT